MVLGSWAPGQREEAAGAHSLCWCGQPLPRSHSSLPIPHLGAWPARHSRYAQSESWAGPGLSCEERTFQEAASGTQSPERGPAGTRLSRPAPRPRRTSGGGMGGGDVMSSICLTCPSFLLPPSASHPSRAVTCAGKGASGGGQGLYSRVPWTFKDSGKGGFLWGVVPFPHPPK